MEHPSLGSCRHCRVLLSIQRCPDHALDKDDYLACCEGLACKHLTRKEEVVGLNNTQRLRSANTSARGISKHTRVKHEL